MRAQQKDGRVAALCVPGGGSLTRGEIDAYTEFVKIYGAKGLAYVKVNARSKGRRGIAVADTEVPFARSRIARSSSARRRKDGDLVFFGADKAKVVNDSLGALRLKVGQDRGLVEPGWRPLWVLDFPMFEWDEQGDAGAPCTILSPRPRTGMRTCSRADPGRCAREGARHRAERLGRSAAARSGFIAATFSRRCSARSTSAPTKRRRSSASCWRPCSTVRLHTAASRSASIGS